jgi:urea carboxylase
LLVEYGERVLDLALRFRVHLLEQKLRAAGLPGIWILPRRAVVADSL